MPTFNFYGIKSDTVSDDYQQLRSVQPNLEVKEFKALSLRSADSTPIEITTAFDDLVIMQMSNGVEWHYRADDFETFLKIPSLTSRGAGDGKLEVPSFFTTPGKTRGFDEVIATKGVTILTGLIAKDAARALANKMESSLDTGMHGLNDNFQFISYDATTVVKNKPYLLFIHGTNSSTTGAFRELMNSKAYATLFKFYEGRILAYEHKTLTESPLKNVTDLLNLLPNEIIVDVVSHSRGGLIADLLARCSSGGLPFDDNEMKIIGSNDDLKPIQEEAIAANKAASAKKITVAKLVRVACPSAGTVVIDKRLDVLVNVLGILLKLIPGAAACMPFTIFLDFIKAVVHERTDVGVFPGLAAQIPNSPLIRMLNNPNRKIDSELFVISGDVESSGILKTILVMSTNLYFGEAHDLVVNSNSMFKGSYRSSHVKEHFEQESDVNHFNYFKNKTSQDALLTALTDETQWAKFYQDIGVSSQISVSHIRGITGNKPAVFVLPGIMGSNLNLNNERLWLNYIGIADGILSKLDVTINAKNISPADIHGPTYNALMNYLSADFDVIPFAYDWRLDLAEAGKLLAKAIKDESENPSRTNPTFHFIAHSMGGLVLRSMINDNSALWQKITEAKKTKVLMMGVPNEGSYATIRILLGKDSIIKRLALLDFKNTKRQLLDIFKLYPGLLQLLPQKKEDVFKQSFWKTLSDLNNEYTAIPKDSDLNLGQEFYSRIENTIYDNEIFRYIAGKDDNTPENLSIFNNKIVFTSSQEGDGRVLWSTIPSGLAVENIYYVTAEHGSIPRVTDAFEGFKDLLLNGTTKSSGLSRVKPSSRGVAVSAVMPDGDMATIPTEAELNESLLSNKTNSRTKPEQKISVSIINGDLAHSSYPVVVGHFKGDGIVEAEKILDRKLDNYLNIRHASGNYPDDVGTHEIVIKQNAKPMGAIVVGLGDFGELSENMLLQTLKQALLSYIIKNKEERLTSDDTTTLGISYLLIGTGFGGLTIYSSAKALLNAVKEANAFFDASFWPGYRTITEVEIIELHQYKSVQAGRVLQNLVKTNKLFSNFLFIPNTIKKASGARNEIPDEMQTNWWQRLKITCQEKNICNGNLMARTLVFDAITDKARNDQKSLQINTHIVDALIKKAATSSNHNKELCQTLYELLLPNEFKGYGNDLRNIVLMLDQKTARYPWEMLLDAYGNYEEPMVTKTGFLRQYSTSTYRDNPELSYSKNALVIGNPSLDGYYPDLPMAGKEAIAISQMLDVSGYSVNPYINKPSEEAILHLYATPYKILHIAAHGVLNDKTTCQTGVVLGPAVILTPADFKQMRKVPELVFINCCSLANSNLTEAEETMLQRKYEVAGSIGTELIEMGVKAVIVAGWEVDDSAASLFSSSFYSELLDGKTYGDAIAKARQDTFLTYPSSNTWGAYQCYGDPFYTLRSQEKPITQPYLFCDIVEAVNKLETLISEMETGTSHGQEKWALEEMARISDAVNSHPSWQYKAELVELYAEFYKTMGESDKAISYYERLFSLEDSAYTLKSIEQYCNVKVKQAKKDFDIFAKITNDDTAKSPHEKQVAIAGEQDKADGIISNMIDKLKQISPVPTSERYNLIGSAYRRKADIHLGDTDIAPYVGSLLQSASNYFNGYKIYYGNTGKVYYYPFYNWLITRLGTYELANNKQKKEFEDMFNDQEILNVDQLKEEAAAYASDKNKSVPDFWHKTAPSMQYLYELAGAIDVKEITNLQQKIADNHRQAWAAEGSVNKQNAVADHARFIQEMLTKIAAKKKKQVPGIKFIKQKIAALTMLEKF